MAGEFLDDYAVQLLYPLKKIVKADFKQKYPREAQLQRRARSCILEHQFL